MNRITSFKDEGLLYISLNQDGTCIVAGTERGFKIFDILPLNLKFERVLDGGIGLIEMLYKTNILALVGGGKNPKYTPNKVILWDDYQTKIIQEFKFSTTVKNIKLKINKLIVVCEHKIHVYETEKYKQIDLINTYQNALGIIGLSNDPSFTVIAYPDAKNTKGFIKVKSYEQNQEVTINAHDNLIAFLSINDEGTLVASASTLGTEIRIFYIKNGEFIEEFRRGKEQCLINFIAFDKFSNWLCVCSNRGTVHIWSLGNVWKKVKSKDKINRKILDDKEDLPENKTSILKYLPNFITGGAFDNSISFAQLDVVGEQAICSFQADNCLIAITASGKYYEAKIDVKNGGQCNVLSIDHLNYKKI